MNEVSSIPVHPIPRPIEIWKIEENANERARVYFHAATRADHIKACRLRLAKFSHAMSPESKKQLERKLRRLLNRQVRAIQ